jgi:hypothetical protein
VVVVVVSDQTALLQRKLAGWVVFMWFSFGVVLVFSFLVGVGDDGWGVA